MRNKISPSVMRAAKTASIAVVVGTAITGAATAQTLPVWDDYTEAGQVAVMEELNANFEAAHDGVTVERTMRTFNDLAMTLKLAVSNGDGPVVTKVNQGPGDMGAMVAEDLLVPVDKYIAEYGWDAEQSDSVLARDRWSEDGQFGEGETYGISGLGEMVGLYYNAQILEDAGIEVPETFEEFQAALDTLKEAGQVPFMMGTASGHMALHMYASLSQAFIDSSNRAELDDLVYARGGTWKTEGNIRAAEVEQTWANEDYFFPGYQGMSDDDAIQLFTAGQGAFAITGTWYFGQVQNNPDIHFMPVPGPADIAHPLTVGGVDLAWAITSIAEDEATEDLAGAYLDYMVSDEAALIWARNGFLPSTPLPEDADLELSQLLGEGIEMWGTLNANDAVGHYPDWATPTMYNTMTENLPLLLAEQIEPEAYVDALEADFQDYLAAE